MTIQKTYKKTKKQSNKNKRRTRKQKPRFLYNPNNPKTSFDVYIDKNPDDTIPIQYSTVNDVINTIKKLERLFKTKQYSHKRIWQVGMILKVRLEAINKYKKTKYKKAKDVFKRYHLAKQYFKFLGKRTSKKTFWERKQMTFKIPNKHTSKHTKQQTRKQTKPNPQKGGKWSDAYKKSIDCSNPKGFSQRQHCKYGRKTLKKAIKHK